MASGFKNGQCLNNKCVKYKGEIFKIPVGADFVCPECGKKLMEVAVAGNGDRGGRRNGDRPLNLLPIIIGGVLLVAGIVTGILLWGHGPDTPPVPPNPDQDTTQPAPEKKDTAKINTPDVKPDPNYEKSFPYYVSYGIYKGDVVEGYAQGKGELIFTKQHAINKLELKPRMAQKGWRIDGTFFHGLFIMGDVYNENDELIECPVIGKPANAATAYDEKLKNRY